MGRRCCVHSVNCMKNIRCLYRWLHFQPVQCGVSHLAPKVCSWLDALCLWHFDQLRNGSCLSQLVSPSIFLLKRANLGGCFDPQERTFSFELKTSYLSHSGEELTSQNQVLTREPEVFRRCDATVQPKGQIQSAGKQSFGFNDPKIWPYVFVDSSWVVQPNADFPHPWDAHKILELEGKSRDPPRCRWGAAFRKPDKKLTVCFCMTKTYMHNVHLA